MSRSRVVILLGLLFAHLLVGAQTAVVDCEQDLDNHASRTSFCLPSPAITCYHGSFSNPLEHIGIVNEYHSHEYFPVGSPIKYDDCAYDVQVVPYGGLPIIKVGSNEMIPGFSFSMDYKVVPQQDTTILLIHYLSVMRSTPGFHAGGYRHLAMQPPYIEMQLLLPSGEVVSGSYRKHVEMEFTFWQEYQGHRPSDQFTEATTIYIHPWDYYTVPIIGHKNDTLTFRAVTNGCDEEYCYADLYLAITPMELLSSCCDASGVALSAPKGYQYTWYAGNNTLPLSTDRTIGVPSDGARYRCQVKDTLSGQTFNMTIDANANQPKAQFDYTVHKGVCGDTVLLNNHTIRLTNNEYDPLAEGELTYEWTWGDNQVSHAQTPPPIIFTEPGDYTISLTAFLENSHCSSSVTEIIHIEAGNDHRVFYDTICEGQSFGRGERQYSKSGIYLDTITNAECGGVIYIEEHLFVAPTYVMPTLKDTICAGEYIVWQGRSYNKAGHYEKHLTSSCGCDSVVSLDLTMLSGAIAETTEYDTICYGTSIVWNGKEYSEAGFYTDTLRTITGCDSITHLDLETYTRYAISDYRFGHWQDPFGNNNDTPSFDSGGHWDSPFPSVEDSTSITPVEPYETQYGVITYESLCGTEYVWKGHVYTQSGVYADTAFSIHGCDSISYLVLELRSYYSDTLIHQMKSGEVFFWRGRDYTLDGFYTDTVSQAQTCDSIYCLDLRVCREPKRISDNVSLCEGDSIIWRGRTISKAGTFIDTVQSSRYCDSAIYQLNVSMKQRTYSDTADVVCLRKLPYLWHSKTIYEEGEHKDTLVNAVGCDSIVTLHLTIDKCAPEPPPNPRFCDTTYSDTLVIVKESQVPYMWNDVLCYHDTTFTVNLLNVDRCDSLATIRFRVVGECEFIPITLPIKADIK